MADHRQHVPPVHSPDAEAEAILHAANTLTRDIFEGSAGMVVSTLNMIMPGVMDLYRPSRAHPRHAPATPSTSATPSICPATAGRNVATTPVWCARASAPRAKTNPMVTGAAVLGAGAVALAVRRSRRD